MVWILGHYGAQKFENLKISQICRLDFLEITCDDEQSKENKSDYFVIFPGNFGDNDEQYHQKLKHKGNLEKN